MILDYKSAKQKLLTFDIDGCQRFFEQNGYLTELGYCYLLTDRLDGAKNVFKSARSSDKRANWAFVMTDLLQNCISEYPTYFELRNFLEIDLNILINAYKGEYVEKLISYADLFFAINPEVYKFIGRVFINNNFNGYGYFFLQRAKDYFYNDPELHYLLAEYYFNNKDYAASKKSIQACMGILPDYYPAVKMLGILNRQV